MAKGKRTSTTGAAERSNSVATPSDEKLLEDTGSTGESIEWSTLIGHVQRGNCIELMRQLPTGSVQLIFADPPFNIGYEYDEYDDRLEREQYLAWSKEWISQVKRVVAPNGAFWLAIGDEYAAELKLIAQEVGFHCRSWVIWYYTFGVHCRNKFTRSHAHLFHFVNDPTDFVFHAEEVAVPSARQLVYADARANPKGRTPDDTWILRPQDCAEGLSPNEDTWYFPRVAGTFKERAGFHGCQMPEQLLGRIVRVCSSPGDSVLDPFAGSASTLVVAKKLHRRCLGFDLSSEYVQLGNARLDQVSAGDPLVGAGDPKLSAPATRDGKQIQGDQAGRSRKSTKIKSAGNQTPLLPFSEELLSQSEQLEQAFRGSHRGFSPDRCIIDPWLNASFQANCDRMRVEGSPAERNRLLLKLRSRGRLSDVCVDAEQRTAFEWCDVDRFAVASEIAWRTMMDLYRVSLEEILCDPELAIAFDRFAMDRAPGRSPLEYRWTALMLRREMQQSQSKDPVNSDGSMSDPDGRVQWSEHTKLSRDSLVAMPACPAVYELSVNEQRQAVYIGYTLNLRCRLESQCQDGWLDRVPGGPYSDAELSYKLLAPSSHSDGWRLRTRRVQKSLPLWNVWEDASASE
jgi:site-specific DNA-methyltransferase (adenine-specific)